MIFLVDGGLGARDAKLFFWFSSRWNSAKRCRWSASEGVWERRGVETSHCTSNRLFHRHQGRKWQLFPTPPCTQVGFKKFLLHFLHRPCVVHAGAQLDTRGHRSATDFALGPFFTSKFPSTEKARKLWPSGAFIPSWLGRGITMVVGIMKHCPQVVCSQASILVPVWKGSTTAVEAPY